MDAGALNAMLEARVKDLADRKIPGSQTDHQARLANDKVILAKALGLHPAPPKTDLKAEVTGVLQREGYRIEKLRYESRPGVLVTAHLYVPDGAGPFSLILSPHGHWEMKKTTPWVQARGIGLALLGMATLIVDSPGHSFGNDHEWNERAGMGTHDDWFLCMGAPVQGQYVWDLVRGLDYCTTRPDIDTKRVGITGTSGGGTATMLASAFDERIYAAVPVCAATSMISMPHNGCLCNHTPGLLNIGDRADVLAIRAPRPIMLIGATVDPEFPPEGHLKTHDKLKAIYKLYKAEADARLDMVEGQHDYSRRMREAMYAFFAQHLLRQPPRGFIAEPRPLSDGGCNPYEAGTENPKSPELQVTTLDQRQTVTFRQILEKNLREPYPEPLNPSDHLAPWGRHGRLEQPKTGKTLGLHDHPLVAAPPVKDSVALPVEALDERLCIYLGLSVSEFLAQVLHLSLAGRPENWEPKAVGTADALTSMIASVKTLVQASAPGDAPDRVVAEGPVSSMVAQWLRLYRPELQVECSHRWNSWSDLIATNIPQLAIPNARYLEWPFGRGVTE